MSECDHYICNSKTLREAMCFVVASKSGNKFCYFHYPQRFDGIGRPNRYSNGSVVFFGATLNYGTALITTFLLLSHNLGFSNLNCTPTSALVLFLPLASLKANRTIASVLELRTSHWRNFVMST
ncbi:unnamed protein product [Brassica rapa subsp. trilocularis]